MSDPGTRIFNASLQKTFEWLKDVESGNFHASLQKTFEWLRDVESALSTDDRQMAYHALRAVLQALRDRLRPEEACDLAEQLPALLRGIYYEGWSPADKPVPMNAEEFLERVKSLSATAPNGLNPVRCVPAVFGVLQKRIAAGEISDVRKALPKDFAHFWPAA